MPIYTVQAPDGSTMRIEGPDGASDAEIIAQAQRLWQVEQTPAPNPATDFGASNFENAMAGVGKSLHDTWGGLKQLGVKAARALTPDSSAHAQGLDATLAEMQADEAERRRLEQALMDTKAGMGGNIAGHILQVAGPGALLKSAAATTQIPAFATASRAFLPQTIKGMAAQGAAIGAIQPTVEGESAMENAALGGLLGGAVPSALRGAGSLVKRAFSPAGVVVDLPAQSAAREAAADLLQRYGITPTLAQRTGSQPLQALESTLATMPSTSADVLAERAAQQTGFNRAVTGLLGDASDTVDDTVMQRAFIRIGDGYKQISAGTSLQLGDDFVSRLADIDASYSRYLPSTVKDAYRARLDDLVDLAASGKPLSGERYQAIRSELGKAAAGTSDAGYKDALKGLQRALDEQFAQQVDPATLAQKLDLDKQYRAAKILNDASLLTADKSGLSAAKAANKLEREIRKGPVMPELAGLLKAGGQILPDRIPNSGTAQRTMIQNLITGQAVPGAIGVGSGLLSGDTSTGAAAYAGLLGARYLGPKAALAMLRNPTGARWIGGQYALNPNAFGMRAAGEVPRYAGLLAVEQARSR